MKKQTYNILYVVALVALIALGVVLFYDKVYFFVTGRSAQSKEQIENIDPRPDLPRITTDELEKLIESGDHFLLLDVRERDEFATGHIKGAVNIPSSEIDKNIGKLSLVKDKPIVTVCDASGCNRSEQVAVKLIGLGFNNVRAYSAGVNAWVASGHALDKGTVDRESFVRFLSDLPTPDLTPTEAQDKIRNGAIIIDVQNDGKEHISGAKVIALEDVYATSQNGTISKDATVIFYASDEARSKTATEAFIRQGYKNSYNLKGGIAAWKDAGLSVGQ